MMAVVHAGSRLAFDALPGARPEGKGDLAPRVEIRRRARPTTPTAALPSGSAAPPQVRGEVAPIANLHPEVGRSPRAPRPLPLRVQSSVPIGCDSAHGRGFRPTRRSRTTTNHCETRCDRLYSPTYQPGAAEQQLPAIADPRTISQSEVSGDTTEGRGLSRTSPTGTSATWVYSRSTSIATCSVAPSPYRTVSSPGGCRCRRQEGLLPVPATPITMSEWRRI